MAIIVENAVKFNRFYSMLFQLIFNGDVSSSESVKQLRSRSGSTFCWA